MDWIGCRRDSGGIGDDDLVGDLTEKVEIAS